MTRLLPLATVTALGVALLVPAARMSVPSAAGAAPPVHTVVLTTTSGSLPSWPAYDASVHRFALEPSADNDGTATVTAQTSDPAGRVRVNGQVVPNGQAVPIQLESGHELSVIIDDAAGHSAQSWIELPQGFPHLSATGTLHQDPAIPDAHVFLTLSNFLTSTPYETIADANGVPSWFQQDNGSDLKPVDLGATRYSVARQPNGGPGWEIDELDSTFHTVASHRLEGVPTATDFHDSELLPGGRTLMLGYAGRAGLLDAVIQIVDADGHATFTWNSKDHVDPAEAFVTGAGAGDYAHINSVQYLPASGDILASFRNLSQVMRIATTAHDGFQPGDVIWKLGGKLNQFTFNDDPLYYGNCAQHMARLLPNGHLMLFDNGSRLEATGPISSQSADMCANPADPTGPRIARPQTRVTEYALDEQNHTATLVWEFVPPDHRYAAFAGSQQRLPDGDTFIGWSQANDATGAGVVQPVASQVTTAGDEVWKLFGSGWFSYRAHLGSSPDALDPAATITSPQDGANYTEGKQVVADYGCSDTGGSNLDGCEGTVKDTSLVDTTPGSHSFTVTATDGAGNSSVRVVHYHVDATSRPDGRVRSSSGRLVGDNRYGGSAHQRVTVRLPRPGWVRTLVTVQNDGVRRDRMTLHGAGASKSFVVAYRHGGIDVTGRVRRGTLRTGTLAPGATYSLTVLTRRTSVADAGAERAYSVRATSLLGSRRHDAVAVVARATR